MCKMKLCLIQWLDFARNVADPAGYYENVG